jgi:hypothetical protein
MCKRFCKVPKLNLDPSEWRGINSSKSSNCHWIILFLALSIFAVWMAQDYTGMGNEIEYVGSKQNKQPAIEISGVDFVDEKTKTKHQDFFSILII